MINIFVLFCSHAVISENLLFVWEPFDLVMSWHAPRLPKWRGKDFSKKSVVRSFDYVVISKRGCIIGCVNFLKGLQRIFRENRKMHNCIIIIINN